MKSLEEVKAKLKEINIEEPDTPIYDFDAKTIYYPKVDQTEEKENIEFWARYFILIHLMAKIQKKYWSKYEFPLDKNTSKEDWNTRNTPRWFAYEKLMKDWEKDEAERAELNQKLKEEWWPY